MKKLFSLLLAVCLFTLLPLSSMASPLNEMKDIIRENYYGDLNESWQDAQSIQELIPYLDSYSTYMTAEQYDQFNNSINSTTIGIGVVIEKHVSGLLVTQVIENTNASKQGIEPGDIITHINGQAIAPLTLDEASTLLKGKVGTTVSLSLKKENGPAKLMTIERQQFYVPNTTSQLLAKNVGYISLSTFSQNASTLLLNEYIKLKNQGATSFIIDLRYNTGGYVSAAENVIGLFPDAPIAYIERTAKKERRIFSTIQYTHFPNNTRVLINGYSASASEMVAAALKDQRAAILYGQQTYGKGVMQSSKILSDGSYFKLTTAEFLGPNDTKIQHVGIKPDVITSEDALVSAHQDAIISELSQYRALPALNNVPTNKVFTLTFNNSVLKVNNNAIELIELGTNHSIAVSTNTIGNQLIVTPTNDLKTNTRYLLIINPAITNSEKKSLKRGFYTVISVK